MILKSMMSSLPPLEFIYDLESSGDLLPAVQALVDQRDAILKFKESPFNLRFFRVDIDPELYNMYDWRYEYVDFAYPNLLEKVDLRIISARQFQSAGEVINGVFDTLSYGLFLVSTLLLGLLLGLASKR